MRRLLICLPLCFLLAPVQVEQAGPQPAQAPEASTSPETRPDAATMEHLAASDPVAFLETCLQRTRREVTTYRAVMHKQERIDGTLHPPEKVELLVREQPYSILMRWLQGERRAKAVLYVETENQGRLLALPAGFIGRVSGVISRDVDGAEARQSGRYTVKDAGLQQGTRRTVRDWIARRHIAPLQVEYLGVRQVLEADGRWCYTLRRTCPEPEFDGLNEVTIYIDRDTWLQVGSVVRGPAGLIGSYYYTGLQLNVDFPPEQFQRSALSQ